MKNAQECEFEIGELLPIGLTLVVLGVGLAYSLSVSSDIRGDMCTGTYDSGQCRVCSLGDYIYNSSANNCYNSTNTSATGVFTLNQPAEFNASTKAIEGVSKIPAKMPLIGTVLIAVVIIGLLVRYLMVRY